MDKVSVVIPTYNRAHLIEDALNSCFDQSYRPLEIIVVDDGSGDDTVHVVKRWKEQNSSEQLEVKYIHQSNSGGNAARNKGIKASTGEFVAFLDSDDVWGSDKLIKQMALFNQEPERLGAVYCGLREVDQSSNKVLNDLERTYAEGDIFSDILIRDVTGPTSTFVVRRTVFDQVGFFDEELQARQDWDMWIRISREYEIKAVRENLVDLRHHSGARTATNPFKEIEAYASIREKYRSDIKAQPLVVQLKALSCYYKRLGRVYGHQNISRFKALSYLFRAVLVYPLDFDNWAAFIGFFIPGSFRKRISQSWNVVFAKTPLRIRSH